MSDEKRCWKWWHKAALGIGLVLATLWAVLATIREPWIEPLPGVRVEPERPPVTESKLGPGSAYRLLLQAIERPPGTASPDSSSDIWGEGGWSNASLKFERHGWPSQPSPARSGAKRSGRSPAANRGLPWGAFRENGPAAVTVAPWTLEQVRDVPRLLGLYRPNVALLDRALADPAGQMPMTDPAKPVANYMPGARSLARLLLMSAWHKATTGDPAGAFQDLARIRGLSRLVSSGGALNGRLLACALDALAADKAWRITMQQDIPTPVLLQAAPDFLASADHALPLVEAVRVEAMASDRLVRWSFSHPGTPGLAGMMPRRFGIAWFATRLLGSNATTSSRNLRTAFQHVIAIVEKPYSQSFLADYERFRRGLRPSWDDFKVSDPFGCLLASMLTPRDGEAYTKVTATDANLKGIALFLAIQAYEKERGESPEQLEQLVPNFLPRVPEDPFDRKPFRYLRTRVPGLPTAAWAVYSVGPDFVDDGGKAHGIGTSHDPALGANPDLVWPSHAYPAKSPGEQAE